MFQLKQLTVLRTNKPRAHEIALGRVRRQDWQAVAALAEAIQKRCMIDDPAITRIR